VIRSEVRDHVAEVVIDNPPVNALPVKGWFELADTVRAHGRDEQVRALIVSANPELRGFQAGVDIKELAADPTKQSLIEVNRGCWETFAAVYDCEVPVIAAVHGYCLGGGIDLVTACDIRYASRDAIFSIRETKIAIVADVGTLQRLPAIVGKGHVAELAFTGDDVDAKRAEAIHLVNRVFADGETTVAAARDLAERIAANSPLAVQGTKRVLDYCEGKSVEDGLRYVATWNAAFLGSDDLREAMAAFAEKRKPKFTGR